MDWLDFDTADYNAIYDQQLTLVRQRQQNACDDTVLMGEHPPVLTVGRGFKTENLLNNSIPIVQIERGGDITYHGPGQLVIYPIIKLEGQQRDLHLLLRQLEEWVILVLNEFGITGFRKPGWTGVWVTTTEGQERKIASIGVAVRQWVTFHGIGFNVTTDLTAFKAINPCGLPSQSMVALHHLLTNLPSDEALMTQVKQAFQQTAKMALGIYAPI